MKISTTYPKDAVKLYHRKAGDVIQFCKNDGTTDSALYMVVSLGRQPSAPTAMSVVELVKGSVHAHSVSERTILFPEATLLIEGAE